MHETLEVSVTNIPALVEAKTVGDSGQESGAVARRAYNKRSRSQSIVRVLLDARFGQDPISADGVWFIVFCPWSFCRWRHIAAERLLVIADEIRDEVRRFGLTGVGGH